MAQFAGEQAQQEVLFGGGGAGEEGGELVGAPAWEPVPLVAASVVRAVSTSLTVRVGVSAGRVSRAVRVRQPVPILPWTGLPVR